MVQIEKGFKTSFALAFIAYVAITVTFSLISAFLSGSFGIESLASYLFQSVLVPPNEAVAQLNPSNFEHFGVTTTLPPLLSGIGALIACTISAIIAGWMCGGGKKTAFISWYLIAVISSVIIYVVNIVLYAEGVGPVFDYLFGTLLAGLLIGIFYGAIAMLVNPEYY
ncbi:MAG: hypothetical protein EU547_03620 [Promethearchaeota archaeon]|nr:MAG: hypothetical protein EU547_03620 [Candidatus Lokiarchaeota archaeon]